MSLGRIRIAFLDRDGVINRAILRDNKPYAPSHPGEMEIQPGAPEAVRALKAAGFIVLVATNQPDVSRGLMKMEDVEGIHKLLAAAMPLDGFEICYHDDKDHCECRKPRPGLLVWAMQRLGAKAVDCFMVGDRWRDIEAGRRAGCRTAFIDYDYNEPEPNPPATVTVRSVADAAAWIIAQSPAPRAGVGPDRVNQLGIKIFADGADLKGMLEMYAKPYIKGFTTNPTLMRKAGLSDYEGFAREVLAAIKDRPISFEVFADEPAEMKRQALKIAQWGANVNVKIPVTNTRGESAAPLIAELAKEGVKLNITAICTLKQIAEVSAALAGGPEALVSVFAGRIADTGRDPVPLMTAGVEILREHPNQELLWASPRELLNIFQADAIGCHVITVTNDILKKLALVDKDLGEYSLDTVKMFFSDAQSAGYKLA